MTNPSQFHNRGSGRRTGQDRRAAMDRRSAERRQRQAAAATDRRDGAERRAQARRDQKSRRRTSDRRAQRFGFGPVGTLGAAAEVPVTRSPAMRQVGEVTDRDLVRARRLADQFVSATGNAEERVNKVVRLSWPRLPMPVRNAVVAEVLPVLTPLMGVTPDQIPARVRKACEEAALRGLQHRPH